MVGLEKEINLDLHSLMVVQLRLRSGAVACY
jgi:hypothetical protein